MAKRRQQKSDVLLATTPSLEGKRIVEHLGLVRGFCSEAEVAPRQPLKKVSHEKATSDMFGENAQAEQLREAAGRAEEHFRTAFAVALGNLCAEAKAKGANAVVGLSVNTNEQFASVFSVIVIGTAVRYE